MAILNHGSSIRTTDGGQSTATIVTSANIGSYAVASNATYYIGTTQNIFNRASGAQTLTGVSIDGNAATVTNGVYTTGTQTIGGDKTFSSALNLSTGGTSARMFSFYTNLTNTDDWTNSAVSIRERDLVAAAQSSNIYSPNINFHWASRISNSLWMDANGNLAWGSYDGSGVPSSDGAFYANNLYASIYFDKNDTTYYLDAGNTGTSLVVAGKVGVGITSPSYSLELYSGSKTSAYTGLAISNFNNYDGTAASLVTSQLRFAILESPIATYNSPARTFAILESGNEANNSSSDGFFAISTRSSGTVAQKFRITSTGNVGIGTTSPLTKLDIANTQASGITMRFDTSTSYQAWIRPYWNSTTDSRVDFAINRAGGSTPDVIMSVGYGSNVGVGTTTPSQKLHVIGTGFASTDFRAPIFYDNDNTAYYCDPASTSNLNAVTLNSSGSGGYLTLPGSITVSNVSGAEMVIRGLSQLRFSTSTSWDWNAWAGLKYDYSVSTIYLGGPAATSVFTANATPPTVTVSFVGTNNVTSDSNFKAPIFYDSDNTAYYINAASGSNLNTLTLNGILTTVSSGTAINFSGQSDSIGYNATSGQGTYIKGTGTTYIYGGGVFYDGSAIRTLLHSNNYSGYSTFSGSVTSTYGNFTAPGLIIGDAQYGFYVSGGNVYYKSASGGVHYWRNIANSANTMSLDNSGNILLSGYINASSYIYTATYLQTGGNLIYPSGYGATQRLEVSNSANNNWIDGLTIAPGGIVTAPYEMRSPIFYDSNDTNYYGDFAGTSRLNILNLINYAYINGQTLNGQSFYQWEGATFRNPADHTPQLLIRKDNSTTGINGFAPALALYNNNGSDQTTVGMAFVSAEAVSPTQGNSVELAGIIAKKESSGTAGAWSQGSLNFFVKDFGTRRDVMSMSSNGVVTAFTDIRSPIFYDSNNTTYYCDPSSTSNLVGLTVANTITGSVSGSSASCTGNAATASNATQFGGEANTNFMRGLAGGTEANINNYTDNGFRSVAYTGHGKALLSFSVGSSIGTVQQEYFYNIPANGWRVRNKTDSTTWSSWGNVVMTDTNQGALTGTVITTGNSSGLSPTFSNLYAAVFYDSANSSYYLDPNSLSNIRHTIFDIGSNVVGATGIGVLFDGNYTSGQYRHRFRKYDDGNGLPLYVDYAHATANSFTAIARFGGGGSYNPFSVYGTADASGDFRAPIFYDSNDTTYYIDPANGGFNLRGGNSNRVTFNSGDSGIIVTNAEGVSSNVRLGCAWGRPGIYNGSSITVGAETQIDFVIANAVKAYIDSSSNLFSNGSVRSPIFYDSNNTAFYIDAASTSVLNRLTIDGGNYANNYFQSLSDFVNGTLVTTDIPATAANGLSFVMNVVGKSYNTTTSPFNFSVQGYLYNSTIINFSGLSLDSTGLSTIKIFENGGFLCFWWARVSYWNAFEVSVRSYDTAKTNYNRVTNITDVVEPTGTKKVTVTLQSFLRADVSATNAVDLRAPRFYDSENVSYYVDAASTSVFNAFTGSHSGGSVNVTSVNGAYLGVNNTTNTNGYGISLYNGASAGEPTYGLMFQGTGTFGTHGSVTGDWATYFTMNNDNTRGWVFRKVGVGNVASISAGGIITATTFSGALSGNATTATTLATARTFTIGSTGKTFNGSADVSWSLAEIGAVALAGSTMTGVLTTYTPAVQTSLSGLSAYNAGVNVGERSVTAGVASFVPAFGQNTVIASQGYRSHMILGSYRNSNANWAGGPFIAWGGNDAYPTEYWLFNQGGAITHSSGTTFLNTSSTLTAGNLSGTIPSAVLGNSAHFIGTTSIALNRASAAQSLTGVNIDGSSGSCTGNAATATTLATARTFTIGSTGKTFNGSADVSWSTTEIVGYTPAYGTAAYQTKSLDTITTPGLYQYDGAFGGTKPPDNSPNYRTIEIGSSARFSQIAMPWNSDGYYFRRYDGTSFSTWRTVLHDGNYNSYAPTLTGTGASGSWGISVTGSSASCTGNAATATTATSLNSSNSIARTGTSGNYNTDFQNTPAGTVRHQGDDSSATNNPGGTWWFVDNYRHSNGSNYWGTQVAWGWEDQANKLATRNVTAGTFGSWVYYLNSVNYNSYSPTLTGTGASGSWGISVTGSSASCTGNAATVTNGMYLSGDQFISGAKYFTSNKGATSTVGANSTYSLEAYSNDAGAAGMSFHRGGYYAVNMGLDPDNVLRIGGWSASANRLQLDMSGNLTLAGVVDATQFRDSANTAYFIDPASTSNINGLTLAGSLVSRLNYIDRSGSAASGINWYSSGFTAWTMYMASAGTTGCGPTANITAPSGTIVTSWALRSFIENVANYGWTWESGTSNGQPSVVAELRSSDGAFRIAGAFTGAGTGLTGTAASLNIGGNAGTVSYAASRTDSTTYPVLWGLNSGSTTQAYSCASVYIQSSTGYIYANAFYDAGNTAYYVDPASTSNLNAITAAGNITAAQYYTGGWFRNNSSGNGLYNESTGEHFYSDAADMWNVASANGTQGIRLRTGGHNGTVRGYFYGNDSNDIGFLNNSGNWRVRVVGGDYVLCDGSSVRAQTFIDSNDTSYYGDFASTSILNRLNYQQLRRNFASSVYSGTPSGSNNVKTFSGVLVAGSANGTNSAYTVIETSIPQDSYQMGGFTINWFENYSNTNTKTTVEIAGYWNPVANGGFIGFEYTTSNPNVQPTIRVGRNSSGNTVFILDHFSSNYTVIIARDLWLGYNSTDGEWATGWTMTNTTSIAAYSNVVSAVLRVGPTLTGTGASGTWGINITGNSATATTATSLNSSNSIARTGTSGNYNTDFQNTPAGTVRHQGDDSSATNNPGGTWWFVDNYRHSNGSNYWGTQVAWGWEDQANKLATRNITANSFGSWVYYLNSVNYNSYSPTLTGTGASGSWGISVTGSSASCTGNAATATLATKATRANGNFYIDDNYGNTVVGLYSANRYQGVFAMGDSYKLAADGTGVGTLYGIAWSHPNAGGVASNLSNHGALVLLNGTYAAAISTSIRCTADMRTPIYYDSDNTAYYCDPASTSNLVGLTVANTITGSITGNAGGSSASCTGNAANVTGTVAVANGGTGATSAGAAATNLGLGTGNTPKFLNVYGERVAVTSASSTTVNTQYNVTELTMSASITTLTLSNIQASTIVHMWTIVTVGNGTTYSITWPAAIKWPGGTAPTITATNTKRDIYQFVTYDGGTTIYAIIVGQNL